MPTPTTRPTKIKDMPKTGGKNSPIIFDRFQEFCNLIYNQVAIYDKESGEALAYPVQRFVKRALFGRGMVGYDKISKGWYFVSGAQINELGDPKELILYTANGREFRRPAYYTPSEFGAYLIRALSVEMSIEQMIKATTDFLNECEVGMKQNAKAIKTPWIVTLKDTDLQLSLKNAIAQQKDGEPVIIVSPELGEGIKSVNIAVDYVADKLEALRDRETNRLLTRFGVLTADAKRERVQSAEVNASIGEASDYIYMIIDTFNDQMETYGLPFEMRYNGSMEEIYLDENGNEKAEPVISDMAGEKGGKA